jgi:hypothetical protein
MTAFLFATSPLTYQPAVAFTLNQYIDLEWSVAGDGSPQSAAPTSRPAWMMHLRRFSAGLSAVGASE